MELGLDRHIAVEIEENARNGMGMGIGIGIGMGFWGVFFGSYFCLCPRIVVASALS